MLLRCVTYLGRYVLAGCPGSGCCGVSGAADCSFTPESPGAEAVPLLSCPPLLVCATSKPCTRMSSSSNNESRRPSTAHIASSARSICCRSSAMFSSASSSSLFAISAAIALRSETDGSCPLVAGCFPEDITENKSKAN